MNGWQWSASKAQACSIPVTHGQLEAVFHGGELAQSALVIIAHPHPLHDGTMDNKVVTTLSQSCRKLGVAHLRYNSRGVGKSTGSFDHGLGESEDLLSIIAQIQSTCSCVILAGFSFGAYVAYRAACHTQHHGLLTIAPAVNHGNFSEFQPPPQPWQVIAAGADEIVPLAEIQAWYQTVMPQPDWQCFEGCSHFFHGRLIELRQVVCQVLGSWLN